MGANRETKVKSYYEVVIALNDDAVMDQDSAIYAMEILFQLPVHNGVHKMALEAIDRIYEHECYASFRSVLTNFDVIEKATELIASCPEIKSIEITYQFPYEFAPGKVILRNGECMEVYDGEISWTKK